MIEGVEAEGWRFVAFVRLVPFFPFNLMNYALGLTRIKFLHYIITSLVCMAPGAVAFTWIGYAGREALSGNDTAIRYGLLALGLFAAIAFIPRIVRRMRGGETPRWIEVATLADQLRDTSVKIIDVREPDEFNGPLGHIAAASNLPLGELSDRLTEISAFKDKPVILVCRTDKRSASAAGLLKDAGFRDARVLRGGMEQWNRDILLSEGGYSGERA
jgi:rhodanese-related sulfurtransferase